jgi:hypothetical protein
MSVPFAVLVLLSSARVTSAQVAPEPIPAPAPAAPAPDDTPSIKVGATIFADYSFTKSPTTTDIDGNVIHPSAFNVARSYINITGNISHIVSFRVTPDVVRETSTASAASGNLVFRVKYAYAQFNLDDWLPKGSYARFGIQQTPWLEFLENIYRYRFQGTLFAEREGYQPSADAGAAFRYPLPSEYGDVYIGVFNGEGYTRAEANDQKGLHMRASARPFAKGPALLRGLRAAVVKIADNYVNGAPRDRFMAAVTFEHKYINGAFEYLGTKDQTSTKVAAVEGRGYSIWATPKSTIGIEGLLRHDRHKPNRALDSQVRSRTILGIAYWFPRQGTVSSALLLDYDAQTFHAFMPALPKQSRVAVHGLVSF